MNVAQFKVDLEAIAENLVRLRERAGGRPAFAAVKADAYGHGLVPVARRLEPLVAGFGVATVGEGVDLRRAGITVPILKFSPALPEELDEACAADLSLCLASLAGVTQAADAARRAGKVMKVHLKVDTGMRRVGFQPDELLEGARAVAAADELCLEGVFTHLPVADDEAVREFTSEQIARFVRLAKDVQDAVGEVRWVHAANSAGILNHDLTGTNAVRPGIALYGSLPAPNSSQEGFLEPVATWTSHVTHVKWVAEGEGVSYGLTWRAPKDSRIATVAIGYGDGFSRRLSSRGRVLIGGQSCPVVGRVCMDQIMVDVTDLPTAAVGDEVVLIGRQGQQEITVAEMAELVGTIPYEITCLVTKRVVREY